MNAWMPPLVLVLTLAALVWFQRRGAGSFRRFRATDSQTRQLIYLRWAMRSCLGNLGVALAGLALLGRLDAPWRFPDEFVGLALAAPYFPVGDPFFAGAVLVAAVIGLSLSAWVALRRPPPRPRRGYDITPILPRNRAELIAAVPVILVAGFGEEVYFRLFLPLLLMLCGAPDWAAFLAATLLFALVHRYQGWLAILVTGLAGAVFALLYLGSWGLALPIALHLWANFNTLLLRPALALRFRPRTD